MVQLSLTHGLADEREVCDLCKLGMQFIDLLFQHFGLLSRFFVSTRLDLLYQMQCSRPVFTQSGCGRRAQTKTRMIGSNMPGLFKVRACKFIGFSAPCFACCNLENRCVKGLNGSALFCRGR